MARSARPWFCARTGWWKVYVHGKKIPLAQGKHNLKAAKDALGDLQAAARHNPSPDSPQQTVVSVIERYIEVSFPTLSAETRKLRHGSFVSSESDVPLCPPPSRASCCWTDSTNAGFVKTRRSSISVSRSRASVAHRA